MRRRPSSNLPRARGYRNRGDLRPGPEIAGKVLGSRTCRYSCVARELCLRSVCGARLSTAAARTGRIGLHWRLTLVSLLPYTGAMIRSRAFAVLLSGLFFLHLLVAGSGFAMGMSSMDMSSMGMGGASEMQTMSPSASAVSPSMAEQAAAPASDEAPCDSGMPCDMPGMPGGCPSTLPCPSVASVTTRQADVPESSESLRPVPLAVRAPYTRLSPPELPPPRA